MDKQALKKQPAQQDAFETMTTMYWGCLAAMAQPSGPRESLIQSDSWQKELLWRNIGMDSAVFPIMRNVAEAVDAHDSALIKTPTILDRLPPDQVARATFIAGIGLRVCLRTKYQNCAESLLDTVNQFEQQNRNPEWTYPANAR